MQYFADILILIGFFVLSISLFTYASSFIVSLLSGIDFKTITNGAYDFNQRSHINAFYWINALSSIGGFFVSAWLFILYKRYYFKQAINIRQPISAIVWPLIPILFISVIIISSWLNQLNIKLAELPAFSGLISQGKMLGYLKSLLGHMDTNSELLVNMFFIALIPAVCEEVFFRGVFQKLAIESFGNVHIGIVITSFIFALIHFNFLQILPMMFLAMVFGYVYHYTKSIFVPIALHFINNSFSLFMYYVVQKSELASKMVKDEYSPDFLTLALTMLVTAAIFTLLIKKYNFYKSNPI